MLTSISTIFILIISCVLVNILLIYLLNIKKNTLSQTHRFFTLACFCMSFWLITIILQATLTNILNINPIYFEYLVYIGACFLPVSFFFLSISFSNTKYKFSKKYKLLFVIPIISLIALWTNDIHHLFYKVYSVNISETVAGPFLMLHNIYSYVLLALGLIRLLQYSIKNAGFFSRQSIFICLGVFIPVIINLLGTFGIIKMTIYITPISFAVAILLFALAIFKFDFLKITPIALQRSVDRISDSYIVLNEDNKITDFNQTFLDVFNAVSNDIRNKNLFELIGHYKDLNVDANILKKSLNEANNSDKTVILEKHFDKINKDFHIEINRIESKGNFLGTLILLKDVTQHNIDMQTIKDNQDMLVEKERLASLGQMIGGIAHNLKTPIMSIAGATEGLSDLIKEYDSSIEDPEVTPKDHHDIAKDMNEWIEKIKTHLSYMSDVITAIKGQAVAFSEQTASGFTVKELINYVDILMKHELKNALITLNLQSDIDTSTTVKGNINSLVQVINNIISNAIQAYQSQEKTNGTIDFRIYKENNNLVFKISDMAGGLPDNVTEKLFKEMITTKGKNGTGLGLFMSYSNIKAHFNGKLRYETEKGKGTSFFIEIPIV